MRVLLAAAPHRDTFGYSMPPPGLLRLGGACLRHGIEVELEDLAYRLSAGLLPQGDGLADAAADHLLARDTAPDVIGISVMGATLPIALAILRRVRERAPPVRLWLGGPGTTGVDQTILERFPFVDAIVRGEGEVTLVELVAALERAHGSASEFSRIASESGGSARVFNGSANELSGIATEFSGSASVFSGIAGVFSGIAGVTWRRPDGTVARESDRTPIADLATLPPYAFELLPPLADYKRITGAEDGLVPIDSGRGCVFDCSFCTIGRFWSRRSRTLPAARLVDEVASLATMPSARSAYLCHDLFGANRGQAIAFCDEMLRRGVRVPWEVRARADHLDRELLERMGQAGCYRVLIGVESADAAVRERNQKGMRDDVDMLAVVSDCAAAGIVPILSLILGLPGEDEGALRKSLDLCAAASLRAGVQISLHLVNPQPGCGLGEEYGERSRPIEGIPPDMALGAGETASERELIAAHPDLFTTWALLPDDEAHMRNLAEIAQTLPDVLMRYPRTFALLRDARGFDSRGTNASGINASGAEASEIEAGGTDAGGTDARRTDAPRADSRELDALDLYRAWKATGKSFESFAIAVRTLVIDETLRWEQAIVRASTRREPATLREPTMERGNGSRARGPRALGEVLEFEHDLSALARDPSPRTLARISTWLAIVPSSRGVQTVRVSRDVASLMRSVDGELSRAELEQRSPGIGAALETLARAGLVRLDA